MMIVYAGSVQTRLVSDSDICIQISTGGKLNEKATVPKYIYIYKNPAFCILN